MVFLSFLSMFQIHKCSEPMWQLAPNVGNARENTISTVYDIAIPRGLAAEWVIIILMGLWD